MSSSPISSYSRQMPDVLVQKLSEFLEFPESAIKLRVLDTRHETIFRNMGYLVRDIRLPASFVNKIFENIRQFPKLEGLNPYFRVQGEQEEVFVDADAQITSPNVSKKLTKLTIIGNRYIPPGFLNNLLERTPQLTALNFSQNTLGVGALDHLEMRKGQGIGERAKANLGNLQELDITRLKIDPSEYGKVHAELIVNLFKSSQSFISATLIDYQRVTTEILGELVKSKDLAQLKLILSPGILGLPANYQILSQLQKLESFAPSSSISEEEFIEIIFHNPLITKLDLTYCPRLHTDRVLHAIAENLPNLREIFLGEAIEITDRGMVPFMHNCKQLRSLVLYRLNLLTPPVVNKLRNLLHLERLCIIDSGNQNIDDSVLDTIFLLKMLNNLSIPFVENISAAQLLKIQCLEKLRSLNIIGCENSTDEILRGIISNCPELSSLLVGGEGVTDEGLNNIWDAIAQNQLKLGMLIFRGCSISSEYYSSFKKGNPNIATSMD